MTVLRGDEEKMKWLTHIGNAVRGLVTACAPAFALAVALVVRLRVVLRVGEERKP